MGGKFQCFYGFQYERRSDYGLDLKYACIRADCDGAMTLRSSKDFVLIRPHNHPRIEIDDPETATSFIVVEGKNKRFAKVFERPSLIIREGKCEVGGECEIAVRKHERSKAVVRGIFKERGDAVLMMLNICEENGIDLCDMDAEAKAKWAANTVDPELLNAPEIPSMESLVGNFSDYLKALLENQPAEDVEDPVGTSDIKKEIKEEPEDSVDM
uniref:RanBD1 domain-containing protein n=1 Tax=Bursaphelenchus xylophilus TaxID=6326 RepID=A0A1I7SA20_BURXY